MIYNFLKILMRISVRFFFRNVQVKGLEHIPETGPLLIVSNHPNTILDPIVIACFIRRKVFFIAKAELFKSKFAKWVLPKLSMLPIYRAQDDPTQMKNNDAVFSKCYEHLKNNGAILIFPEGVSLTNRQLKKIKTGTARIALGAEAENDFKLGVKIVSVGLNYSDPHSFYSDLFINMEEPVNVQEYENMFAEDSVYAVNKLTDEIRLRLEKQIVAIEDAEVDRLIKNIEVIYKSQLLKDMGFTPKIKEHDFIVTKEINREVHYYYNHQPQRVELVKREIDNYFKILNRLELSDRAIKNFPANGSIIFNTIKSFFYMLMGLPVFVFGFVNNYIPYRLPELLAKRISASSDFYGALKMLTGTFTFFLFYGLQIALVQNYFQNILLTLCYAAALPTSGFFAFFYWKRFNNMRGRWTIFSLFYRKTKLITSILTMRQHIIDELEKGRKEFAEMNP